MIEEDDFLSDCEHVDENLIAEAKKRQKEALEAKKKSEKEAEEAKKKIIPPEVLEFRKMAIPFLQNFNILNKKEVGFFNEEYRSNDTEVLSYLNYFEERFKITHAYLNTEEENFLNKIKNFKNPETFELIKILDKKYLLPGTSIFFATLIIHEFVLSSNAFLMLVASGALAFSGYFLYKHFKSIEKNNLEKNLLIQEYQEFLSNYQKTKKNELLNMYDTKYMPSLSFEKKVLVKKIDADFIHLKNKVINIPRLIYESLKTDNKYWNQYLIDKILKSFHYDDNIQIEEYLAPALNNEADSKYEIVNNFMTSIANKKERFYNSLINMNDEDFQMFLKTE